MTIKLTLSLILTMGLLASTLTAQNSKAPSDTDLAKKIARFAPTTLTADDVDRRRLETDAEGSTGARQDHRRRQVARSSVSATGVERQRCARKETACRQVTTRPRAAPLLLHQRWSVVAPRQQRPVHRGRARGAHRARRRRAPLLLRSRRARRAPRADRGGRAVLLRASPGRVRRALGVH